MTGKMYFPNAKLYCSSKGIKLSFILNYNMCEKKQINQKQNIMIICDKK